VRGGTIPYVPKVKKEGPYFHLGKSESYQGLNFSGSSAKEKENKTTGKHIPDR